MVEFFYWRSSFLCDSDRYFMELWFLVFLNISYTTQTWQKFLFRRYRSYFNHENCSYCLHMYRCRISYSFKNSLLVSLKTAMIIVEIFFGSISSNKSKTCHTKFQFFNFYPGYEFSKSMVLNEKFFIAYFATHF